MISISAMASIRAGLLQPGALLVATAGVPLHTPGNTNLIRILQA